MKWISSTSTVLPDHGQVVIIRSGNNFELAEYNAFENEFVSYQNPKKTINPKSKFYWSTVTPPQ
jgi:hypothetical protein